MSAIEKQSTGIKGGARPGAGRKAGVPNKRTAEVQAAVEASGITPLEYMLSVMRSETPDTDDARVLVSHMEMRMDAAKAAAPYVHAKLANVTVSGDDESPLRTVVRVELVAMSDDDSED